MACLREQLLSTLNAIADAPLLVVGDLILDRYIWGSVERISQEAPVPVVNVQRVEDRLGGAGNVVRNLTRLGAKVNVCGLIGDDDEGKAILALLDGQKVGKDGVIVDRNRKTSLKTRVIARTQQLVRIDREVTELPAEALREGFAAMVEAQVDQARAVVVSDYAKGVVSASVMAKIRGAHSSRTVGLASRPLVLDPKPPNYSLYSGISVATPNRKEAEIGSGTSIYDHKSALVAAHILIERWNAEMMMVTLGQQGLVIASRGKEGGICLDTAAVDVFDVSGAGDTVAAVFAAALAVGASAEVAGNMANMAAGIVVSEIGTSAIDPKRLREQIEKIAG